jgi:hypothetical protein
MTTPNAERLTTQTLSAETPNAESPVPSPDGEKKGEPNIAPVPLGTHKPVQNVIFPPSWMIRRPQKFVFSPKLGLDMLLLGAP